MYRIEPDQEVEISVDALNGARLKGRVIGIAGATAATFSLLPQNNTTGNFVKVAQVVPVKIAIENPRELYTRSRQLGRSQNRYEVI